MNWLPIQQILIDGAKADVLILLDCCYSASAARGPAPGRKEILAAGAEEVKVPAQSSLSTPTFSRAIINQLKENRDNGTPLVVSKLHVRLIRSESKLKHSPFWAVLVGQEEDPITLFPVKPFAIDSLQQHQKPKSVLIYIHLSSDPAVETWKQWLTTNIPKDVAEVKIGAIYHSDSTVLIMSISMDLWAFLPQNPAYSYIGVITSDNLLSNCPVIDSTEAIRSEGSVLGKRKHHQLVSSKASMAWTPEEDEHLKRQRTSGSTWVTIQKSFPGKSADACQKRHRLLTDISSVENMGSEKFKFLADAYMVMRKEMWSIMSERIGIKWQQVEAKVTIFEDRFD